MNRICFISLISPRKKLAVSLSLRERLFLISLCSNDCFLSHCIRTIVSYPLERLFRTKQTKKEPACSVMEQAGVPIDRVIGLSIDRKGLFYLLTLESIGFVPADDEDLTVDEDLCTLYIVTLYIVLFSVFSNPLGIFS